MKFLNNWNKYKMLKEAAKGGGKMNKLFIQSVMEEYNKYSENAKEAISKIIENTSDDMISKMVQYIGGNVEKSKNLLLKISTGLYNKGILNVKNLTPDKYHYFTNKSVESITFPIDSFVATTKEVAPNQPVQYATIAAGSLFAMNSSKIDGDTTKIEEAIKEALSKFDETKPIVITASCSTLRNSGDAENITWIELSQKRADAAKALIEKHKEGAKYQIDLKGKNGDGTTGNQSPYEKLIPQEGVTVTNINGKSVKGDGVKSYYELFNFDAKFWKSASTEAPLATVNPDLSNIMEVQNNVLPQYMVFQFVNISIPTKEGITPIKIEELNITMGKTPIKTGKVKNYKPHHKKYKGECPDGKKK